MNRARTAVIGLALVAGLSAGAVTATAGPASASTKAPTVKCLKCNVVDPTGNTWTGTDPAGNTWTGLRPDGVKWDGVKF